VLTLFLVAVILSAATSPAWAADPYVVYTANRSVDGAVILRLDPASGALFEISRNGPLGNEFHTPYDLAVEPDGSLVVADMGVPNQRDGSVVRVDPLTGRQSVVSSGGVFYDPAGIAVGPGGVLYVLDNLAGPNSGAVIRVDPATGAQQLIASNFTLLPLKLFDLPFGIAVAPDGGIIVANRALTGALPVPCLLGTGSVFRVDPVTFAHSPIATGGRLAYPLGIAIDPNGGVVVANECGGVGADGLVRVAAGNQQDEITSNSSVDVLQTPERVAFDPTGNLLVTDFSVGADNDGGIVRVNPATGEQTPVHTGALFNHPLGIAVVTNRPPTAGLAVTPAAVAAGRPVSLDAAASRDPEGLRLVYEWDLDGDGSFEAGSGTTPAATPRFANDGFKTVRVRVNDPHGGRAVAEGRLRVDGSMPVITGLRVGRVLGLRRKPRGGASAAAAPRVTQLRFRLSETARVTVALDRIRAGRRRQGQPCRLKATRGRRCTIYTRARTIRRSATAGENAVALRARGLKPGRYRITVTAVDPVGNRSAPRRLPLRVVRVRN
jgi:DNA-binding beta-propeller fold protein YncE